MMTLNFLSTRTFKVIMADHLIQDLHFRQRSIEQDHLEPDARTNVIYHIWMHCCSISEGGFVLPCSNSGSHSDSLIMPRLFWQNYLLLMWKDQGRQHLFCNTSLLGILHPALTRSPSGRSVETDKFYSPYWGIKIRIQWFSTIIPQIIFSI